MVEFAMTQNDIIDCYNKTAKNYADKYIDELSKKHFDRILLSAFAAENAGKGKCIDLGCGPGQTTKFLSDCGVSIVGTDISSEMISVAKSINPHLDFETANMSSLQYADASFGAAVAFHSIVHFTYEQVLPAFKEIKRILRKNGEFLFSFHVGSDTVHLDNFLEQPVNIDFYFFETKRITGLVAETGFEILDVIERPTLQKRRISKPTRIRVGKEH